MKVILLKDIKEGKANTIIEVSNGYATNYLIAKGLALPYNEFTKKQLDKKLNDLIAEKMEQRAEALKLKQLLENDQLEYILDAKIDSRGNLNVHHAISTKEIFKDLQKKGYKLNKYAVQKVHLVSNGLHIIEIHIFEDIKANLKVNITLKQLN
ncbi:50S ribosomal protein L9 [Mycoplasma sp. 1018B]|uniref:50S ribosomal protein L9 n=1 Tax=Mycoplasma sp. 1018B TaxID=2967302 RepID=UPI00211C854B|nr:50S ribosomal protein L9 [Mycoplasma sp. 1018B]UUM19054.1 50S ribosomal protein L9 [Mycoplasma sp. 1018B]